MSDAMNDPTLLWSKYVSHKVVRAARITAIADVGGKLKIFVQPFDDYTTVLFEPTEEAMLRRAELGGYAVIYDDGYKSISPKAAFEAGYTKQP